MLSAERVTYFQVEMSQDVDLVVPLMISNFVAKLVADMLAKPLYKYQLDLKALPYLDPSLEVAIGGHVWVFPISSESWRTWDSVLSIVLDYLIIIWTSLIRCQLSSDFCRMNLELYRAGDVMRKPVFTIQAVRWNSTLLFLQSEWLYCPHPALFRLVEPILGFGQKTAI